MLKQQWLPSMFELNEEALEAEIEAVPGLHESATPSSLVGATLPAALPQRASPAARQEALRTLRRWLVVLLSRADAARHANGRYIIEAHDIRAARDDAALELPLGYDANVRWADALVFSESFPPPHPLYAPF